MQLISFAVNINLFSAWNKIEVRNILQLIQKVIIISFVFKKIYIFRFWIHTLHDYFIITISQIKTKIFIHKSNNNLLKSLLVNPIYLIISKSQKIANDRLVIELIKTKLSIDYITILHSLKDIPLIAVIGIYSLKQSL